MVGMFSMGRLKYFFRVSIRTFMAFGSLLPIEASCMLVSDRIISPSMLNFCFASVGTMPLAPSISPSVMGLALGKLKSF